MGDQLQDELRQQLQRSRCPYCHDHVEPELSVACQGCLARHHGACWDEHGSCASCGADTALAPREAQARADVRPNPLDVLPEPLAHSKIRVERTQDGLRLTLPGVRAHAFNQGPGAALVFGMVFGVASALVAALALLEAGPNGLFAACLGALLLCALGAEWGRRGVAREKTQPPVTMIELSPTRILIDRPQLKGRGRLDPIETSRHDVGNVRLLPQGLTLDLGAISVPLTHGLPLVPPTLSQPETEWLCGVLQRWRNLPVRGEPGSGGKPPPPKTA